MGESRVVVGLDGCAACQAALRYAIEEAGRRGCELVVVAAYERSKFPDSFSGYEIVPDGDPEVEAEATARYCLQRAGIEFSPDAPLWRILTQDALPVDALSAAASGACVIVIGRHHGQASDGKPVGSTAASLLNHSPVPVISVPPGYQREPASQ